MFCDAHDDQFVNEVIVVGRLSKEAKVSDFRSQLPDLLPLIGTTTAKN